MLHLIELQINRRGHTLQVESSELLIDVLRNHCKLTGTHQGCDTSQCGACTVLMDGMAIKSCSRLAVQCDGKSIDTIEGVALDKDRLHVMQECFSKHHALQCGFCTPGFVMRALAMVKEEVPAEPEAVRHALSGNLCRCTGYEGIVQAICEGLTQIRATAR